MLRDEIAKAFLALQFLTRIPIPLAVSYSEERFAGTPRYYPLVGMLIGSICAIIYFATQTVLSQHLAVALSVVCGILLTGAFHEDGLADTFDGIGGGQTKEQALSIMKDSRLGTYGTLAIVSVLALKMLAMAELPAKVLVVSFISGHGLSRLSSVIVMASSQYVRDHGTGKPVASGVNRTSLIINLLTGLVCVLLLSFVVSAGAVYFSVIGLVIGHGLMRWFYTGKIGGYTGDTLGAVQQMSELGFYLGLAAWL